MKSLYFFRHALNIGMAAAILAACGGGASTPASPLGNVGAPPLEKSNDSKLIGEVFTALGKDVYIYPQACSGKLSAKFTASGNATGPYPGTFTASGHWGQFVIYHSLVWAFSENFTITSGSNTISGAFVRTGGGNGNFTCNEFGAVHGLRYTTSGYGSGHARTSIVEAGHRLTQRFHGHG
jgi:hypothetical protein